MSRPPLPWIEPTPPQVAGGPPWIGPARELLREPTEFLAAARTRYGDTFLLETFGFRLLFLFSAAGVRALYAMPETAASFTEATRG